jgi:hypothetical protein
VLDYLVNAIYGIACGLVSSLVYAVSSNQPRISELKARAGSLRQKLYGETLEPREFMRLSWQNVRTSFQLLGSTLGPALLSALPVVLAAHWIAVFYAFALPPGDQPLEMTTLPAVRVSLTVGGRTCAGTASPAPARVRRWPAGLAGNLGGAFFPRLDMHGLDHTPQIQARLIS